jgi:hypothetical protein
VGAYEGIEGGEDEEAGHGALLEFGEGVGGQECAHEDEGDGEEDEVAALADHLCRSPVCAFATMPLPFVWSFLGLRTLPRRAKHLGPYEGIVGWGGDAV